jgi:hypothetical protein
MFDTTTTENLWLGRAAWTLAIVVLGVAIWWFITLRRRGKLSAPRLTGVIAGLACFIAVGGGGGILEGAILGLVVGSVIAYVGSLLSRGNHHFMLILRLRLRLRLRRARSRNGRLQLPVRGPVGRTRLIRRSNNLPGGTSSLAGSTTTGADRRLDFSQGMNGFNGCPTTGRPFPARKTHLSSVRQ